MSSDEITRLCEMLASFSMSDPLESETFLKIMNDLHRDVWVSEHLLLDKTRLYLEFMYQVMVREPDFPKADKFPHIEALLKASYKAYSDGDYSSQRRLFYEAGLKMLQDSLHLCLWRVSN